MAATPAHAAEPAPPPALEAAAGDEEFIGPFPSWKDVRRDFGAVGDGVADDTAAIQRALDSLRRIGDRTGPAVAYFPAGTYRITRTLRMRLNSGANLIGADSAATTIRWDGEANGTMLMTSGSFDTLFERLTWDGGGSAGVGIAQWWNYTVDRANYQGSIKHVDETFRDVGIGIYGGRLGRDFGEGDSETLVKRVHFIRNRVAGVNLGSFNALDWWIWDSEFRDCARGISNEFSVDDRGPATGAGNFAVYRSVFVRSTVADVAIANTGWFALHANVSVGSRQFLRAAEIGPNSAALVVQANRVVDTLDPISIQVGNEGPLILLDNRIRSREGVKGPVVRLSGWGLAGAPTSDRDAISVGNRFTVDAPIAVAGPGGRLIVQDDARVGRDAIEAGAPELPGPARDYHRRLFEVPVGASAERIQLAINEAAASRSDGAVVHLPPGDYHVARTLQIPAGAHIQFAGDSETSALWWTGADPRGTLLRLAGPSRASVRDLRLVGARASGIEIEHADQQQGRVVIEGSMLSAVRVGGLLHSRVVAQANSEIGSLGVYGSASVLSLGCGGLGPVRLDGNGRLLVADSWYEGKRSALFGGGSGDFTYLAGLMSPYVRGVETGLDPAAPAVAVDRFEGRASFIGLQMALRDARNGISVNRPTPRTRALFLGVLARFDSAGQDSRFYQSDGSSAAAGIVLGKLHVVGVGARDLPDAGRSDAAFMLAGLEQARSIVWTAPPASDRPASTTDVRLYRVNAPDTAVAVTISR